jgi:hypothetical protein
MTNWQKLYFNDTATTEIYTSPKDSLAAFVPTKATSTEELWKASIKNCKNKEQTKTKITGEQKKFYQKYSSEVLIIERD